MTDEKKEQLRIFLMILLPFFFISMWIASQNIARDCHYDELLGWGWQVSDFKIYLPWQFFIWKYKFSIVIPDIIASAQRIVYFGTMLGAVAAVFIIKKRQQLTSYGTARWASPRDVKKSGLDQPEGVTIGINPYKFKNYKDKNLIHHLLREDGPAHIGLFAPTRSGKGASIIINTCLEWKHSLFVLDMKGENFNFTAAYRRKALNQKVIKFEPLNTDGTGAKWNPIAEIRMRTHRELSDVMALAQMIADPDGKAGEKGDSHWVNTSKALIQTIILHLMYAHQREELPIPNLSDVSTFLASPSMPFEDAVDLMQHYHHISEKEFFSDENILEKIYGNYLMNFYSTFNQELQDSGFEIDRLKLKEIKEKLGIDSPELISKYATQFRHIKEVKAYFKEEYEQGKINFDDAPFYRLLVHPKVAEGASEQANRDPKEGASVISSATARFNLYKDPVIANNISKSDFISTDILDPDHELTIYLVIPPNKIDDLKPLVRIFINYLLDKNTEEMNFDSNKKKQRCLLLLDEFPQLGRIEKMETGMAIIAGYGLKVLLVTQDVSQINKHYTKDNSIISNCHVRIFFTPNGIDTAKELCEFLGKKTIEVSNKSESGAFKSNRSWNQTARELMTPSELTQLSMDEEIILVAGLPPIKARKAWYFKIPYYMQRCKNKTYPEALHAKLPSDSMTVIAGYDDLSTLLQWKSLEPKPEPEAAETTAKKEEANNEQAVDKEKKPETEPAPEIKTKIETNSEEKSEANSEINPDIPDKPDFSDLDDVDINEDKDEQNMDKNIDELGINANSEKSDAIAYDFGTEGTDVDIKNETENLNEEENVSDTAVKEVPSNNGEELIPDLEQTLKAAVDEQDLSEVNEILNNEDTAVIKEENIDDANNKTVEDNEIEEDVLDADNKEIDYYTNDINDANKTSEDYAPVVGNIENDEADKTAAETEKSDEDIKEDNKAEDNTEIMNNDVEIGNNLEVRFNLDTEKDDTNKVENGTEYIKENNEVEENLSDNTEKDDDVKNEDIEEQIEATKAVLADLEVHFEAMDRYDNILKQMA